MKKKILIFGSGGHAKVVLDIIENEDMYSIAGFIDNVSRKNSNLLGYSFLGDYSTLRDIVSRHKIYGGVIAIGDNAIRSKVHDKIIETFSDFEFVNCVHPRSIIGSDVNFGKGNVVMAGAVINPYSIIYNHCIINSNSTVEHDCKMGNFSSIATNASIGGNVHVGNFSAIGIGANVFHNVTVGNNCIIGGGSLVNSDTINNSIYYGSPSKLIRNHNFGDNYL
mgnify:CR=1 FL=1